MSEQWRELATRKRKERAARIPPEWTLSTKTSTEALQLNNVLHIPRESGVLTAKEIKITEDYDATGLLAELAQGRLRAVDVAVAFCKRAAIAQQLTNCLTEVFFDEGIARAKQLDAEFKKTGRTVGPLHGLPISLKDSFNVKGYDTSLGVGAFCFQPAESNAVLVDLLLAQGAVLYCKTGVPQTLGALDSHNNIFGRVLNPTNRRLTAGGSSGGEGALLALRGSPLGVGTDIGGSIRVPSMCNGLVGIKPSHGRVPYAGQRFVSGAGSNKIGIESTAGPLGHSVRDCELFLRLVTAEALKSSDPDVIPQTWDQQASIRPPLGSAGPSKRLRVGIVRWDGHVQPLPPIQNLMDDIAKTLRSPVLPTWESVEVIELDIHQLLSRCVKPFNGIMSLDGNNGWLDTLAKTGEPLSPWLQDRLQRRDPRTAKEVAGIQTQIMDIKVEFAKIWHERNGYWKTEASKAGKGDREIDVFLIPVAPHPTPLIDRWNGTNYTSAFNILQAAAGVLPVRPVRESDLQGTLATKEALNGWDKINREMWTGVDRRAYLDSMMCVQVVAPRLMERRLVEAMSILEEALSPLRQLSPSKL